LSFSPFSGILLMVAPFC